MKEPIRNRVYNPLVVIALAIFSFLVDIMVIGIGARLEYQFPPLGKLILILALTAIAVNTICTYRFIKYNYL